MVPVRALLLLCALAVGCVPEEGARAGVGRRAVIDGVTNPDELGFTIDRFQRNAAAAQLVNKS